MGQQDPHLIFSIESFMKDNSRVVFKEEIKECAGYKYSQSSKVSSLSRYIVYGIIGLVWSISYDKNTGLYIPNIFLLIALLGSLAYLLLDVIHYFTDSVAYHSLAMTLRRGIGEERCLRKYFGWQSARIGNRSSCFLTCKFVFMLVLSAFFVIGIIKNIW